MSELYESAQKLLREADMEDALRDPRLLDVDTLDGLREAAFKEGVKRARASFPAPATCACGDPSRAGVAHRSHEYCRIGYASDEAQAGAEEVCECGHRRDHHVNNKGWCGMSGECDCERFAAPVSVGHEDHRYEIVEIEKQELAGPFYTRYQAICKTCTWDGPVRGSHHGATTDAEEHLARSFPFRAASPTQVTV